MTWRLSEMKERHGVWQSYRSLCAFRSKVTWAPCSSRPSNGTAGFLADSTANTGSPFQSSYGGRWEHDDVIVAPEHHLTPGWK